MNARLLFLTAFCVCLGSSAHAQDPGKMGRDFTTAALRATRVIASFDGAQASGGLVETIAQAADRARSRDELAAVALLNRFASDRIANNVAFEQTVTIANSHYNQTHELGWDARDRYKVLLREKVSNSEFVGKMSDHEGDCVEALELMLRSGKFSRPAACTVVRHAAFDVEKTADEILRTE